MTKKNKAKLLYPALTFYMEELPGCCGIGVAANIHEEQPHYYYDGRRVRTTTIKKEHATREEQAEACYKEILKRSAGKDSWSEDGYYSQLLVSLVSNYAEKKDTHQNQALEDLLLKEGWSIYSVFINPNHGNEVTLYGKYFPERT